MKKIEYDIFKFLSRLLISTLTLAGCSKESSFKNSFTDTLNFVEYSESSDFNKIILADTLAELSKESSFKNSFTDTLYFVEYSESSDFNKIILADTFFTKSKDSYSLTPNTIDIDWWTGGKLDMRKPLVREYFARIKGKSNDSIFYISKTKFWVNIGRWLWVDYTDRVNSDDPSNFYIRMDEEGNIIIKGKDGEKKISKKEFESMIGDKERK